MNSQVMGSVSRRERVEGIVSLCGMTTEQLDKSPPMTDVFSLSDEASRLQAADKIKLCEPKGMI